MSHLVHVVEDEEQIRKAFEAKLLLEGYEVMTSKNGAHALAAAFEKHPAIILLDLVMPVLDGYGMLEKLRQDAWGRSVPVVILSNTDTAQAVVQSLKNSAQAYFIKSETSLETIMTSIADILGPSPAQP